MWSRIRYWLFIGHRWLGIAACLLFAAWFTSGLVMTIVGYPSLDERARVAALRPIDWRLVRITPHELLSALPIDRFPRELALEMLAAEPVYRVRDWDGSWFCIDPASGQIVDFSDRGGRRYRWWFNALHRWDFSALLQYQALWYAAVWTFALAGLVMSITAVVIGWRRLWRNGKGG